MATVIIIAGVLTIVFWGLFQQKTTPEQTNITRPLAEQKAYDFLINNMSYSNFLIYTNYIDSSSDDETLAAGHDVLSESEGLMLLYLLNRGEKDDFDRCLASAYENLYLENGLFSWVKREKARLEPANALIDDLRIARAEILAYEKWNDAQYEKDIIKLSQAIKQYNIQNKIPVDFYNHSASQKASTITLSYLDLYTMRKLSEYDKDWDNLYQKSLSVIKESKIGQTGLYAQHYDINSGTYDQSEKISLVQTVYVLLHLAEGGQPDESGTAWLWQQYEKYGKIYSVYSAKTGKPEGNIESTALYALSARLFYLSGQKDRAAQLLSQCEKFQVQNKTSPLYGSFGDETTRKVYSFDNLMYLLSSSIIDR